MRRKSASLNTGYILELINKTEDRSIVIARILRISLASLIAYRSTYTYLGRTIIFSAVLGLEKPEFFGLLLVLGAKFYICDSPIIFMSQSTLANE